MQELVDECSSLRVEAAILYTEKQHNLMNPPGFVIRAAQGRISGLDLSEYEDEITNRDHPELYYITGKYADFINH